jgi:UDP-N-acetylmuramate dehydrogenase
VVELIERLPKVNGRLTANRPLADLSWLRVGGPAEVLFQPADIADLRAFMKACPMDIPVFPVGVGSNLIIRDGGLPGLADRLGLEVVDRRQVAAGTIGVWLLR